jgi:hypothetical protein
MSVVCRRHQIETAGARFVLTFMLLGCLTAACSSRQAWTAVDAWYRPPPANETSFWGWEQIQGSRLHEVVAAKENDAEDLLRTEPIVELEAGQAADLIGEPLSDAPGAQPYLVRGVYLRRQTGRFVAYVSGEKLIVHHGSLGSGPAPMKRQALVLQLERKPATVFVACSMAE